MSGKVSSPSDNSARNENSAAKFARSQNFKMESSWPELPYTVLTQIIGLLEISDVVNFAKVCENWRKVAVLSLKSVKIDESLPFGGSWRSSNHWYLGEYSKTPVSKPLISTVIQGVADIATSLAGITDEIESNVSRLEANNLSLLYPVFPCPVCNRIFP